MGAKTSVAESVCDALLFAVRLLPARPDKEVGGGSEQRASVSFGVGSLESQKPASKMKLRRERDQGSSSSSKRARGSGCKTASQPTKPPIRVERSPRNRSKQNEFAGREEKAKGAEEDTPPLFRLRVVVW